MPVTTKVLFDTPQQEIASLIRDRLQRCASASIVAGFVTVEGIKAIAAPIRAHPSKLQALVVGSGTYRAFEALDGLIADGVPVDRLFVHLGHTAPSSGKKHPFHRYHPMLHSKIYLMEMGDGTACAFVGSHNITGFALLGLNGEAAVLLEGPADAPEFRTIRQHIQASRSQAAVYSPAMKAALSWWTLQSLDGLYAEVNDAPDDGDPRKTIVVLAAKADDPLPRTGEIIYFEIPADLGQITSLTAEVHIYIFPNRPATPYAGLASLDRARLSLLCGTTVLITNQAGNELKADWFIAGKTDPRLLPAPRPFRPTPSPGMQQISVQVRKLLADRFEYLFDTGSERWEPVYEEEASVEISESGRAGFSVPALSKAEAKQIQVVDKEWLLVKNLRPAGEKAPTAYELALLESSPDAGSYILVSSRRRKRPIPDRECRR